MEMERFWLFVFPNNCFKDSVTFVLCWAPRARRVPNDPHMIMLGLHCVGS